MVRTGGLKRATPLRQTGQQLARVPLVRSGRVNPVSAKRVREQRTRAKVLDEMRTPDAVCAVCGRGGIPLDGHELLSRARGGSITDPSNISLVCREDHTFITQNPAWAEAHGWALKTTAQEATP